jgi:hypothetical protein
MPQSDAGDFAALFLLSCNICETFSGYISDGQSQAKKKNLDTSNMLYDKKKTSITFVLIIGSD